MIVTQKNKTNLSIFSLIFCITIIFLLLNSCISNKSIDGISIDNKFIDINAEVNFFNNNLEIEKITISNKTNNNLAYNCGLLDYYYLNKPYISNLKRIILDNENKVICINYYLDNTTIPNLNYGFNILFENSKTMFPFTDSININDKRLYKNNLSYEELNTFIKTMENKSSEYKVVMKLSVCKTDFPKDNRLTGYQCDEILSNEIEIKPRFHIR